MKNILLIFIFIVSIILVGVLNQLNATSQGDIGDLPDRTTPPPTIQNSPLQVPVNKTYLPFLFN